MHTYHPFRKPVTCNGITYIGLNIVQRTRGRSGYLVDLYGREICSPASRRRYSYAPPELNQRIVYI